MCWRSVENILFDRNVLVIELIKQTQCRCISDPLAKSCLPEFVGDFLDIVNAAQRKNNENDLLVTFEFVRPSLDPDQHRRY